VTLSLPPSEKSDDQSATAEEIKWVMLKGSPGTESLAAMSGNGIARIATYHRVNKLCLILFTPFAAETKEIAHNAAIGVDVPDLSFGREDIERHFAGLHWKLIENIRTESQYGVEHVYFVWRK
jgi:hypothetical protein